MKIIWAGKDSNVQKLEFIEQYKPLDNWDKKQMLWMTPICFITPAAVVVKTFLLQGCDIDMRFLNIGFLISIILFFVHEIIHACVYPHTTPTYIFYNKLGLGTSNLTPMTRNRFLLACMLPMLILGVIPLIILLATPNLVVLNSILSGIAFVHIGCAMGDLSIFFSVIKLPKGAHIQISGTSIYWKVGE